MDRRQYSLTLAMVERHVLAGTVVDAEGRGVAEAMVEVEWGTGPAPEIGIVTDRAGRFRIALPDGRYRLRATAGAADGRAEVDASADRRVDIVVKPSGTPP